MPIDKPGRLGANGTQALLAHILDPSSMSSGGHTGRGDLPQVTDIKMTYTE